MLINNRFFIFYIIFFELIYADNIDQLSRISVTLSNFKSDLIDQQTEYVIPVKSKLTSIMRILDVFTLFHAGVPINSKIIARKMSTHGNEIRIRKIFMNIENNSNKIICSILSDRLKGINFNLRKYNQTEVQHQINKRSCNKSYTVNKILLLNEAKENFKLKSLIRRNLVHYFEGRLKTEVLGIKKIKAHPDLLEKSVILRSKRSKTIPSTYHLKIVSNSLNNIYWNDFVDKIYRRGVNLVVNGNITLSRPSEIVFLHTDETNGFLISTLMTIPTDQIVKSNVYISEILTADVMAQLFNDMKNFANNIVLLGRNNAIESRVRILFCNVKRSMKLSDDEGEDMTEHIVGTHMDDLTQIYNGRVLIKGSVDTNNIFLSNIKEVLLPNNTQIEVTNDENSHILENVIQGRIFLNGIRFEFLYIWKQYWMKKKNQVFYDVNFNKSISCPQASIVQLNGILINDYLILSDQIVSFPVNIEFQAEVKIKGNLNTDQHLNVITLQKLKSDAILRIENLRVTAESTIEFKENLLINHLTMQINTSNIVQKSTMRMDSLFSGHGNARKHFKHYLYVSNNILVANSDFNNITIHGFNEDISLSDRLNSIIAMLDGAQKNLLHSVIIFESNCNAEYVITYGNFEKNTHQTDTIQIYAPDDIFRKMSKKRNHRIQLLFVYGPVTFRSTRGINMPRFQNLLQIEKLNEIKLHNYFEQIVSNKKKQDVSKKSNEIGGEKTFIFELNATIAHTNEFNQQLQMGDWLHNVFRLQRNDVQVQQIVSSGWQFFSITTDNFQTKRSINQVKFSSSDINKAKNIVVVDDNPIRTVTISSDISFSNEANIGLNSEVKCSELRPCNLQPFFPRTSKLVQNIWCELSVLGNVKVLSNKISSTGCVGANCLFETALSSQFDGNINSNIIFNLKVSDNISFLRIRSLTNSTVNSTNEEENVINKINFISIFNDAITRSMNIHSVAGQYQVKLPDLSGPKEFFGTISGGTNILSSNYLFVNLVNGVNVNQLNHTLFHRHSSGILSISILQNLLFLDAPLTQTIKVNTDQTINGVFVENIYFLYSKHSDQSSTISFKNQFSKQNVISVDQEIVISLINGLSLDYFLNNRGKLFERRFSRLSMYTIDKPQVIDGFFTFETCTLYGDEIKIEQVNNVICDEIVLTHSNDKQEIKGYKEINGKYSMIYVEKPFHVWKTNNVELVSMFAKAVFLSYNQILEQCLIRNPYHLEAQKETVVSKNVTRI